MAAARVFNPKYSLQRIEVSSRKLSFLVYRTKLPFLPGGRRDPLCSVCRSCGSFFFVGNGLTGLRGEDKKFYVSFEESHRGKTRSSFVSRKHLTILTNVFFFSFSMDCSVADRNFRFFFYNSPIMYNKFALACASSSKQSP